jgi:hypothetical protein
MRGRAACVFEEQLGEAEEALWVGVISFGHGGLGAGAPNPPVPASGPGILRCVGAAASSPLGSPAHEGADRSYPLVPIRAAGVAIAALALAVASA